MTPIIVISLDGQDISSRLDGRILSGELSLHSGEHSDSLHLTLSNYDGMLAKPQRGAVLSVALGFQETGGAVDRGSFEVQQVTKRGAAAEFIVTAHSADLKKTLKIQKTRSWIDKTLGDVVNQVASDNGLSPTIDGDLAGIQVDVHQTGESDMHLLMRLARQFGALAKPSAGRLLFIKKGAGTTASGAGIETVTITPNDLEEDFQISDKDRPRRGKVKANFYDHRQAKRQLVTEGDGEDPDYTFPQLFGSQTAAQKATGARKGDFDRATKTFSGTLKTGDNGLVAGGALTTSGFGDDDDQDWIVKTVTDVFNDHGYVQRFSAETKNQGGADSISGE